MRIPGDGNTELDFLLFEQRGVISTAQAMRLMSRSRLRHLVGSGRWRSIARGVMITQSGQLTADQQSWIAVLAAGPGAVLAGLAAARAGGLRGRWRREVIDVLKGPRRTARDTFHRASPDLPAIHVHRTTALGPDDFQLSRPHRTSNARSLVDAASWAVSDTDAVSIIAAGCQQRLAPPSAIVQVAERLTRAHRRALILETARYADRGATSPPEIDFLKLCRANRLPTPLMQVPRRDRAGKTRYLDAYFADYGVHIEIDGAQHVDFAQWAADMQRQNDVWVSGDRILRFPAFLIRTRPDDVIAQLRAALRAAGWRRGS